MLMLKRFALVLVVLVGYSLGVMPAAAQATDVCSRLALPLTVDVAPGMDETQVSLRVYGRSALTLFLAADYANALAITDTMLALQPADADAYLYRGCILRAQGDLTNGNLALQRYTELGQNPRLVLAAANTINLQIDITALIDQTTTVLPEQLTSDLQSPPAIIAELEAAAAIPTGMELAFTEPSANYAESGVGFSNYALENTSGNIVFGGTLTFAPAGETQDLELCGIMGRATVDTGVIEQGGQGLAFTRVPLFVNVGISNVGDVFMIDTYGEGEDQSEIVTIQPPDVDLSAPVNLIAVIYRDLGSLYLNGALIIENTPIQAPAGAFSFVVSSSNNNTRCSISNFWGYALPVTE